MVHVALSDAWKMLGYDAKANEETQRAFALSKGLSREERLSLEARDGEASGEWSKVIEIYVELLAFFPDNVEYGLRLATAQTTAGKGEEALTTLTTLRSLPRPASEGSTHRPDRGHRRPVARRLQAAARRRQAERRRRARRRGHGYSWRDARLREAYAFDHLGEVPRGGGRGQEAREDLRSRRAIGGAGRRGETSSASLSWYHGDLERGRPTWEEALQVRRQIGYRHGVAASLHNLGLVLWQQGDLAGDVANMEQSERDRLASSATRPGIAVDLDRPPSACSTI